MRFADFEQVARLSVPEAADLIRRGDPQERVWASWVVAGVYGHEAIDGLAVALAGEPDAGVRRHLLVIFAGFAARDRLADRASKDPDADVRGTASRYLARLCEPDDDASYDLLVARTIDIAPQVRACVADALRTDAPSAVVRATAGLLFDPDPGVSEIMQQRLERGDFPREPFEAALRVLQRLRRDPPRADPKRAVETTALAKRPPPLRLV